jgi:hypothetical protein
MKQATYARKVYRLQQINAQKILQQIKAHKYRDHNRSRDKRYKTTTNQGTKKLK